MLSYLTPSDEHPNPLHRLPLVHEFNPWPLDRPLPPQTISATLEQFKRDVSGCDHTRYRVPYGLTHKDIDPSTIRAIPCTLCDRHLYVVEVIDPITIVPYVTEHHKFDNHYICLPCHSAITPTRIKPRLTPTELAHNRNHRKYLNGDLYTDIKARFAFPSFDSPGLHDEYPECWRWTKDDQRTSVAELRQLPCEWEWTGPLERLPTLRLTS